MVTQTVTMHVDLAAFTAALGQRIQRLAHLVGAGLEHSKDLEDWPRFLPETNIWYDFGPRVHQEPDQVRQTWRTWILENGFRELSETTSEALEWTQKVLSYWTLQTKQKNEGEIKTDDWNEIVATRFRKFHRMGLPAKISFLEDAYEFRIDSVWVEQILSINAARNCLVHRGGFVSEKDVGDRDALVLRWIAMGLIATAKGKEREVFPGDDVGPGASVAMRHLPRNKEFPRGSRLELTPNEFGEVAWGILRFGMYLSKHLERHGRAQEIEFRKDRAQ